MDDDDQRDHIDLLIKLRLPEGRPSITVVEVGVDGPQVLRRNNLLDVTTLTSGGLPTSLFVQLVPALEEPLRLQAGERLIVQLRLSTGITALSEVAIGGASSS